MEEQASFPLLLSQPNGKPVILFPPNRELAVSTEFLGVVECALSEFTYIFKTWFLCNGQDITARLGINGFSVLFRSQHVYI